MTEPANLSPRQRILAAVVTWIEKDGFDGLTTRKIAEQAGTNIASINYYFRSKDLLVEEAMAMTLRHMTEDIYALMEDPGQPFLETLEEVFFYLIEMGLRFPGTILAHLYPVLVEKRYDPPVVQTMLHVFELLAERASQACPQAPPERIRLALVQVACSVYFIMLAPGFFLPLVPMDFSQPGAARELARYQTRLFEKSLEIE